MTVKRTMKRAAVVLAGSVALAVLGTTQAHAAPVWPWDKPNGDSIGEASYTDTNNVISVDDQQGNEKSLLLYIYKPGSSTAVACWDHGGAPGPGTTCTLTKFPENALLEGYLCQGEWAADPAQRHIYWDGCNVAQKRQFRK